MGLGMLPPLATPFVGRERDVAELVRLVEAERLVSLVGSPGCGKTRLAVEVGRELAGCLPGGVRFVELAPIGTPEVIAHAVGLAVGIAEQPGRAMEDVVVGGLADAGPVLLVLDNCEHLVADVAALVGRLLAACERVRVLTTSRAALGVEREQAWAVPPLGMASAVELFVERARSVPGGLTDPGDEAVIEGICARLDCLPLAVELTAAWTRVLSPGQILDRLDEARPEPPSVDRARDVRHDTMAAAVDWSHRLLPEDAQRLFCRLSVFAGTFDLAAVEAIADPGYEVLGSMAALVDHSVVQATRSSGGPMRYRMLEPVRQRAQALLPVTATDGDVAVRQRHFDHYLGLVERYDPWRERIGGPSVSREQLTEESPNITAAFEWARRQPCDLGLRLTVAWAAYFASAGRVNDGLRWIEEELAKGTADPRLRAAALREAGYLAWRQGDYETARPRLEKALASARELDDSLLAAHVLTVLSAAEFSVGDIGPAADHAREALDIYRVESDGLHVARALIALAWTAYADGDIERGNDGMRAALAANRRYGNPSVVAYANFGLAYGAARAEDIGAQRTHLAEAVAGIDAGGIVERADWLATAALLAVGEGRYHAGLRLIGASWAYARHRGGSSRPEQLGAPLEQRFDPVLQAVSPTLCQQLIERGEQMSWDELTADALVPPGSGTSPLTRREREIAELVAEGLTNVDIAQRLVISRRTVETHVDHIKQKLGLTRGEIPAWVLRDAPEPPPQPLG
jgi:predicted ATPase/DNA-binding CsgD family transcriptional regulator